MQRFEAYGWRVRHLGEMANDVDGLEAAIREALDEPADGPEARPTLLVLRSHIGWPAPHLTDTADAHGTPFAAEEIRATKEILGLPPDETFWVPDEVRDFYGHQIARGAQERGRLGGALRGLGRRPGRLGRGAGRPRPGRMGRRPAPLRGGDEARHPPRHQPVHRRHGEQAAGVGRRLRRPDGQQRGQDRRARRCSPRRRRAGRRSTTGSASTGWARS